MIYNQIVTWTPLAIIGETTCNSWDVFPKTWSTQFGRDIKIENLNKYLSLVFGITMVEVLKLKLSRGSEA